jgi:TolA-binding protein
LDTLRETADSTDDVAEASRDLALSYMEMQDEQNKLMEEVAELRQHISSLQKQIEKTRKDLDTTSREIGTSIRKRLGQQADSLQKRLSSVVADYREEFGSHLTQVRLLSMAAVGLLVIILMILIFSGPNGNESVAPEQSSTLPEPAQVALEKAQVQILNGVGVSGVAGQTQDYLKNRGVNVASVGNAPTSTFARTEIYVHSNAANAARKVASELGVPEARVRAGPPMPGGSDVTVVIGSDYSSLPPFQTQ